MDTHLVFPSIYQVAVADADDAFRPVLAVWNY